MCMHAYNTHTVCVYVLITVVHVAISLETVSQLQSSWLLTINKLVQTIMYK